MSKFSFWQTTLFCLVIVTQVALVVSMKFPDFMLIPLVPLAFIAALTAFFVYPFRNIPIYGDVGDYAMIFKVALGVTVSVLVSVAFIAAATVLKTWVRSIVVLDILILGVVVGLDSWKWHVKSEKKKDFTDFDDLRSCL